MGNFSLAHPLARLTQEEIFNSLFGEGARQVDLSSAYVLVGLFLLAMVLLIVRLLLSEQQQHERARIAEQNVRRACKKRKLSDEETGQILAALKKSGLRDPLRGISSLGVFNRLVSAVLIADIGQNQHNVLRAKLFQAAESPASEPMIVTRRRKSLTDDEENDDSHGIVPAAPQAISARPGTSVYKKNLDSAQPGGKESAPAAAAAAPRRATTDIRRKTPAASPTALPRELPGAEPESDLLSAVRSAVLEVAKNPLPERQSGGTREIAPGQDIKVKFEYTEGLLVCGVLENSPDGITLFLPLTREGKKAKLSVGEGVEAYLSRPDGFFYFESEVEEVFHGEIISCRIRHHSVLHQIQRREFSRARMDYSFRFYHVPNPQVGGEDKNDNGNNKDKGNGGNGNGDAKPGERKLEKILRRGKLADISAGGCAVLVNPEGLSIREGDVLGFPVQVPGREKPVKVVGKVLGAHKDDQENKLVKIHVQFVGVDENLRASLARAVAAMLEAQNKRQAQPGQ